MEENHKLIISNSDKNILKKKNPFLEEKKILLNDLLKNSISIKNLQKEKELLICEIDKYKLQLNDNNILINALYKTISSYKDIFFDINTEVHNCNCKVKFESEINLLKIELSNLNYKEVNYIQEIKDLKIIIDKLNEDNIKLINENKNTKDKFKQSLHEKIGILENIKKTYFQHNVPEIKNKIDQLETRIKIITNENILLKDIKENLTNKINQNNYEEENKDNVINSFLKYEINKWKKSIYEIAGYKTNLLKDLNNKEFYKSELININNHSDLRQESKINNILKEYNININTNNKYKKEIEKIDNDILYVTNFLKSKIEEINNKFSEDNIKEIVEHNIYLSENIKNELSLRRKIHNRYMLIRGNMRIFLRIRPFIKNEIENKNFKSMFQEFKNTFNFNADSINIVHALNNDKILDKKYELDYIFNQTSTQDAIYNEISILVNSLFNGNNICILAYGQTCTGKTYSIEGHLSKNPGILLRTGKEIFEYGRKYESFKLSITIVEIYNDNIYNLLDNMKIINLYEESKSKNLIVEGLELIDIKSFDDIYNLIKISKQIRKNKCTEFHERSSRSHLIVTFYLKFNNNNDDEIKSRIDIVDLAGSERLSKSETKDEEIKKEAISINLSLNSLSSVLYSLNNKSSHIPYRDSKLTFFLKSSLNNKFNIILYLHISPNLNDINETIATLDFGERIKKISKHKTGKEKVENYYL